MGSSGGPTPSRRFAVLLAGHANTYSLRTHGDFSDMTIRLLRQPGDEWLIYSVVDGNFPTAEDLKELSGVVVTGSKHDAHGTDPWILELRALLKDLHQKGTTKLLGICFGCQILAHSLGGESGRADCGFEMGIRELQLREELEQLPFTARLPKQVRILEVHQDQVKRIPEGGLVLASSPNTPIEMFAVESRVLGIQGHPEFTSDVVESIVEEKLLQGAISHEAASKARASLAADDPDNKALQRLCVSFLHE